MGTRFNRQTVKAVIEHCEPRRLLAALFPAERITVGAKPMAAVGGDFNADMRQDLAVASNDGTVSILLNDRGRLARAHTLSVANAADIETADLNGDGKLDLVVSSTVQGNPSSTDKLFVLIGSGDGTFEAPVASSMPNSPRAIVTGDFDKDGDTDVLAATAHVFSPLKLFRNNGDGTLASAIDATTSSYASFDLATGDFNGDGHLDIATGDARLLPGDGSGLFLTEVAANIPGVARGYVTMNDFDGDGLDDLAIATPALAGSGQTVVGVRLAGSAQGTSQLIPGGELLEAHDLVSPDLDGDGRPELVFSSNFSNALVVLANNGSGEFTVAATHKLAASTATAWGVANADFDGDDLDDLAVITWDTGASMYDHGSTFVIRSQGDGTLDLPVVTNTTIGSASDRELADLDEDGRLDLVQFAGNTLRWAPGRGDGSFGTFSALSLGLTDTINDIVSGDFNNDGHIDLLAATNGNRKMVVLLGSGDGSFATPVIWTSELRTIAQLIARDFNGDGLDDLAAMGILAQGAAVYLSAGDGSFALAGSVASGDPRGIGVGDFNGDSRPDLALLDRGVNAVKFLLSNGSGSFISGASLALGGSAPARLAVDDLNLDGNADLIMLTSGTSSTELLVFSGNGDGTFATPMAYVNANTQQSSSSIFNPSSQIEISDLNKDGLPDVAVSLSTSGGMTKALVFVRLNTGDGTLAGASVYPTIHQGTSPAAPDLFAGDLNGDGLNDLLASAGSAFAVLLNRLDQGGPLGTAEFGIGNAPFLAVAFDETLFAGSIDLSKVEAVHLGTGTRYTPEAFAMSDRNRSIHFRFTTSLPDGEYQLVLRAGAVADFDGNPLEKDLVLQDSSTFVLLGDVTRDRVVNFDDLLILAQNYGQSGRTFSQGNVDYSADGVVGFDDLLLLAQRYGNSLMSVAPSARRVAKVRAVDVLR